MVGDETNVQGRFERNVGQVVSGSLMAANISAKLWPSNATDVVAIETTTSNLRIVGDVKVPWVDNHDLEGHSILGKYNI